MTPFQQTLRNMRERLGLNNTQLAEYLGVSIHTVTKWLKGTRAPNEAAEALVILHQLVESWCPELHELLVPTKGVK